MHHFDNLQVMQSQQKHGRFAQHQKEQRRPQTIASWWHIHCRPRSSRQIGKSQRYPDEKAIAQNQPNLPASHNHKRLLFRNGHSIGAEQLAGNFDG